LDHFVKNYAVYELAKSIADNGFFPDEVIIVFRADESNRYVLEGNRRVAALKLLLNPEAAPEKYKRRFRILSRSLDRSLLKKVQAVVAPSREAATPIIIEKHTHTTIKPWSVLMEAGYVGNIVEKNPEEQEKLKEMNIDLSRFIKMDRMYQLACSLELPEDVADSLRNKEKFPFTNIERLYNTPQIRKVLGISDDLKKISDRGRFEAVYKNILTDIARKKEDSRSLGKDTDRERYANEIGERVAPSKGAAKPVTVAKILKQTEKRREEFGKKETEPKPRSKKESKGIIPPGFAFRLDQGASVKKLCDELKKMPVKDYPNASAVSFRVMLEKSLRLFLKMNGVRTIPAPAIPRRNDEVNLSDAQLGPMLEYIGKRDTTLIEDNNVKKVLRKFKSSSGFLSLFTLNNIIHNEELCLTEEETRSLWPSLERLFIIMLSQTGVKNGHVQGTTKVPRRKKRSS
ncbi:hypothetical protein KA005_11105, partial [bacterium]|nr:hypothetical protein [bacterium]